MRLARVRRRGEVVGGLIDGECFLESGDELASSDSTFPDDPLLGWLVAGAPPVSANAAAVGTPLGEVELLAPLQRPGKIIAVGLNYADHADETGLSAPAQPLTFAKYPSSIVGPDAEILVPAQVTEQADWEVELAVVMAHRSGPGRRATMADIGAYTVANDVSARDLQFGDGQWTRAKSIDTFCPLGPFLVTPDEVSDPHALRIWTAVNGVSMQDATTADLLFDIPALLAHITETITLEPGDVILTGTPPGVGGFRTPPVFLADGDTIEVGVAEVGVLRNTVRYV